MPTVVEPTLTPRKTRTDLGVPIMTLGALLQALRTRPGTVPILRPSWKRLPSRAL